MVSDVTTVSAGTLRIETAEERAFPMRIRDWERLRNHIASLGKNRREYAAIAWACVGVSVSAMFTAIPWAPAYGTLTQQAQLDFAWVWPAIVGAGLCGLVIGGVMFWAAHQTAGQETMTAQQILDDMDAIHLVIAVSELAAENS